MILQYQLSPKLGGNNSKYEEKYESLFYSASFLGHSWNTEDCSPILYTPKGQAKVKT